MTSRVVFRQRPRSTFRLLYGVEAASIALLVAVHPHDLVDVLIAAAGMTVILTAVGLFAGHQRLIVDGERIWVRIVRWRGPIALTVGTVRGQHAGLRYVTLSPWMLTRPVLGLLAPPLLRNPATVVNARARALFR